MISRRLGLIELTTGDIKCVTDGRMSKVIRDQTTYDERISAANGVPPRSLLADEAGRRNTPPALPGDRRHSKRNPTLKLT